MDAILASKESLTAYYGQLFGAPDDATFAALYTQAYSPDLKATMSGQELDFEALKAHFNRLRAGPQLSFTILYLLREDKTFAWRQTSEGELPDGKKLKAEIAMFGELGDDKKIVRVNELIRFD